LEVIGKTARNYLIIKLSCIIKDRDDAIIDHTTLAAIFEYLQLMALKKTHTLKKWGCDITVMEGKDTGLVFGIPLRDPHTLNSAPNCARELEGFHQSENSVQLYNVKLNLRMFCFP
jgi:hypothetical protein